MKKLFLQTVVAVLGPLTALSLWSGETNELALCSFEAEEGWAWVTSPSAYLEGGTFGLSSNLNGITASHGECFFAISNLAKGEDGKPFWHHLSLPPLSLGGSSNAWLEFDYFTSGFDKDDYLQYAPLVDGTNVYGAYVNLSHDTSGRWLRTSLALPMAADFGGLSFRVKQSGSSDFAGLDRIRLCRDASPRRPLAPGLSVLTGAWDGVSLRLDARAERTLLARGESAAAFVTNRPPIGTDPRPGDSLGAATILESAKGDCLDRSVTPGRTYYYRAWQREEEEEYSAGSEICAVSVPNLPIPALELPSIEKETLDDEKALVLRPEIDSRLEIRLDLATGPDFRPAPAPFISEYGKGAKDNRYLEIYNPCTNAYDLEDFMLAIFENGAETAAVSLPLEGRLPPKATFLVANNKADSLITSKADLVSAKICMTGNDAVGLFIRGEIADVIGRIGDCPKTAWAVSGVQNATANHTLIRREEIGKGTSDWDLGCNQWEVRGKDDWGDLKYHVCTAPGKGTLWEPYVDVLLPKDGLALTNLVLGRNYYLRATSLYNGHRSAPGPVCGPFGLVPEPFVLSLPLLAAVALLARPHSPSKSPGGHGFQA